MTNVLDLLHFHCGVIDVALVLKEKSTTRRGAFEAVRVGTWEYKRLFVEVVSEIRKIAFCTINISSRDKNVEVPRV